jgi:hypothetical protein
MRLDQLLSQDSITEPTKIYELPRRKQSKEKRPGEIFEEPQIWPWLLPDGIHLLGMSKSGILRLWNLQRGEVLATVNIEGLPVTWDYAMDTEGIAMSITSELLDR